MYTPHYDTTVKTRTYTQKETTCHTHYIDWNYPFDDPEHTSCMRCSDKGGKENIEKKVQWLKELDKAIEAGVVCHASNYGGWPRIYRRVRYIGMASCWPYWKPRPTVFVDSPLGGIEHYDWNSLTGIKTTDTE